MTEIKAELVKTLRDRTGIGMMECKEALQEAGGDIDKAIEILRKRATPGLRIRPTGRRPTERWVLISMPPAASAS